MTGKIFISYRRSDSKAITDRIYAWLAEQFGRDAVFYDIDTIGPGVDWRAHIRDEVGKARVVLAIISGSWLAEMQARAVDPKDVLRFELETALARGISVVPVLIERTEMPGAAELPAGLARLPDLNAATVHEARYFFTDMDALAERLAAGWGFERRAVAVPAIVGNARPATADLVVASPYAGPAVAPPKAGERWEKIELPRSLQKLWSREEIKYREWSWGETKAAWNADLTYPVLGFCNRGKVGFLKFPGLNFKSRLLFDNPLANHKEYWQFPICFDWAFLDSGDSFAFAASSGIGVANPSWSSMKRDWNGEDVTGDDWKYKRVFGVEGRILFVNGRGVDARGKVGTKSTRGRTFFELSAYVGTNSRLSLSASRKFAVLCTEMSDHTVLHFPENMLRKGFGDHDTAHEVEVDVISTASNVWCSYDISWHPTRDIFAATRYVGDEETWRIWLMDTTGKPIATPTPINHKLNAAELDWNSTGRFVAIASDDHSISLWDLLTDEVRRLYGHTEPVYRVRFSPDGQRLASISDKEAIIWNPETGERIVDWQVAWGSAFTFRGTFWAPDARMIATTSSNGLEIRRLAM